MTIEHELQLSGELYDVLGSCTSDELASIVDVLCGSPVSVLNISRAFEHGRPDHAKYADQIGDEIYRLSVKTIKPALGKRPSYQEMIVGVCRQIGIPIVPGDDGGNEDLLLNMFSRRHLALITAEDRTRTVEEACTEAALVAKAWLIDEWQPFTSAFLHAAYLRRKLLDEGRLPSAGRELAKGTGEDKALTSLSDAAEGTAYANAGLPTGSLSSSYPDPLRWRRTDPDSNFGSLLEPLLKAVQPIAVGAQMLGGEKLWRISSEGTAHIVEAGHQGMRHLSSVSVASLLGPTAALSLASALIEQRKLEEIERHLADIKAALKDVSRFQHAERRSILTGSIRYFHQVAAGVLGGELASEISHEIERHEAELVRIQDHLTEEMHNEIAALRAVKKDVKAIQAVQAKLERLYDELLLCLRARSCGYQLLSAFPGREAGKRSRLADIEKAFGTMSAPSETTMVMDAAVREKVQAISSYQSKALVLGSENALLNKIRKESETTLDGLRNAIGIGSQRTEPVWIDLRVRDGHFEMQSI